MYKTNKPANQQTSKPANQQTRKTSKTSKLKKQRIMYNKKKYTVNIGLKGGKYIVINGVKKYIKNFQGGDGNVYIMKLPEKFEWADIPPTITEQQMSIKQKITVHENKDKEYSMKIIKIKAEELKIIADKYFPNNIDIPLDTISVSMTPQLFANWNLPENAKLLIVGDVHGDIISVKNLFYKWCIKGYINTDGILAENTYVVSLGDLIDYADKSLNVLHAFLLLRKNNPNNVVLLAGNHEGTPGDKEENISGRTTLITEFKSYHIVNNEIKNIPLNTSIIDTSKPLNDSEKENFMLLISKIGPSMLSVRFGNDNGYYYMMHGMFPVINTNTNTNTHFITTQLLEWPDEKEENLQKYIKATQWNDLSSDNETYESIRGYPFVEIGSDRLIKIMIKNNIKVFIRGHQDFCPTQRGMFEYQDKKKKYCPNSVSAEVETHNFTYDKKKLSCKSKKTLKNTPNDTSNDTSNDAPIDWCISDYTDKSYIIEGVSNKNLLKTRVFTTSMAYLKTRSDAPPGGYICIEPFSEPFSEPSSKPSSKLSSEPSSGDTLHIRSRIK